MTEIFVAVPLMTIPDQLISPSIVKSFVQKIHPYLQVENVYWTQYAFKGEQSPNINNKCIIEVSQCHIKSQLSQDSEEEYSFSLLRQNSLHLEMLQNTLANIKQDLSHLMKDYQSLKKQNKLLTKQLKQKLSTGLSHQNTKKQQQHYSVELLNSIQQDKYNSFSDEHISISLSLNSNINTSQNQNQNQKQQTVQPETYRYNELKGIISSLEKQIGDLTRDNIQLKNTVVYYEERLQFIGKCLQKMEEQNKKEKCLNQNKKSKK